MPITTLDGIIAGIQLNQFVMKSGVTTPALAALRACTHWYAAGLPGASTANTSGTGGEAVTPALGASVAGRIPRTNPTGGQQAILESLTAMAVGSGGMLMLVDRVWQNSGLSTTLTTAQSITPATIPSRDRNGAALGDGLIAGVEWSAVGGAGTPTVTLTYTDQAGTTNQTASFTALNTPPAGTVELFPLASGIRAPTSFIQSATRTSGTQHLCLYRPIASLALPSTFQPAMGDFITMGRPRIYDDSTLQILFLAATAAASLGLYANVVEAVG